MSRPLILSVQLSEPKIIEVTGLHLGSTRFAAQAQKGMVSLLLGLDDEVGPDSLPDDLCVQVVDGCLGLDEARQLMVRRLLDEPVAGDVVTDEMRRLIVGPPTGAEG